MAQCWGGGANAPCLPRNTVDVMFFSCVNLHTVIDWVNKVNILASLEFPRLSACFLHNTCHFVSPSNLTRLKILDIMAIQFKCSWTLLAGFGAQ